MIPRGQLYISWPDIAAGVLHCITPGNPDFAQRRVEELWAPHTVACLSVRSGLDAFFQVAALPPGSEVILSAVTIAHILDILALHHLVAVPVDIEMESLAVCTSALRKAITPKSKAILVAHLFGSRMPVDDVVEIARESGLMLIEDCAQANDGTDYRGHPASTVSMFSFGPIKRQTALGGGLLRFRDAGFAAAVRATQSGYPRQTRSSYLHRVLRTGFIKAVTTQSAFSWFVKCCRLTGRCHDDIIGNALRGFGHGDFFKKIRHQPAAPLMKMLHRRLLQSALRPIQQRMKIVRIVVSEFPALHRPGCAAAHHTHWLFPILTSKPDALMYHLWANGFDATRGASNLVHVRGASKEFMREVLYLPLFPTAREDDWRRMARVIRAFEDQARLTDS